MTGAVFFDTNILVYSRIANNGDKHKKALELFNIYSQETIIISTQVLSELYVSLTKNRLSDLEARETVNVCMTKMFVVSVTVETVKQCFDLKERYGYSYWDSLILSAAITANCSKVYSEDMQDGQIIGNQIRIINPFRLEPEVTP
ncbi:MAG: PIN domain-containing protein [Firmicutes bacterium]|nr:PIN domain-containing protein [Bacillota bacterium]